MSDVTTLSAEDVTAVEMVRMGYAVDDPTDQARCLTFRAALTLDGAVEALRAIGGYNLFDGEAVGEVLARISIGDYAQIQVGREGSPVLYIRTGCGTTIDREGIERELRAVHADELDWDGSTLRVWWD